MGEKRSIADEAVALHLFSLFSLAVWSISHIASFPHLYGLLLSVSPSTSIFTLVWGLKICS
jgi:hypothetical protein